MKLDDFNWILNEIGKYEAHFPKVIADLKAIIDQVPMTVDVGEDDEYNLAPYLKLITQRYALMVLQLFIGNKKYRLEDKLDREGIEYEYNAEWDRLDKEIQKIDDKLEDLSL